MKRLFLFYLLYALTSCQKNLEITTFDKAKISEETRQVLLDYHIAMNKDGLMAEFAYLDDSSDFFWVPPGYTSALNYDSVETILKQNAKTLKQVTFKWDTLQIFPLSNVIANYTGIVNGQMIDTSGIKSKVSIIESGTLIKRDDGWKLLNGQSAILDTGNNN
ncbi:hypothetical protein [Aquimarina sp. 2201CG5-10]|uniref:hypothetical protein n=1 Tax=Aquimarina callyspongiae TaxID=3098150 RepID=UPI002AB5C96D|nr:hypothetical protein [Aquimarina sp. 2201CG5-10]MDY8137677.1 hypothetical protein [Aquimarina sp. 2201CG5-10]